MARKRDRDWWINVLFWGISISVGVVVGIFERNLSAGFLAGVLTLFVLFVVIVLITAS